MPNDAPDNRCPDCGSLCPAGVLLCPACILNEPNTAEPETYGEQTTRIAGYLLQGEIARGGMGVVYRARQIGLDRIVALKVLPGTAAASEDFRRRFQREARAVAKLNHPGIIVVHEVGQWLGQPFLSMDFIDGPSLTRVLADAPMVAADAARTLLEVARAIEHAHKHGVVHRDLKPSNILLTPDGRPVLTDFGLAWFPGLEPAEAGSSDGMGSPPYLPPERAVGTGSDDPMAEDVYGLGAVLYHCLTGRPPFVADSAAAVLEAVVRAEPIPPRMLNPSVPVDLETICLKCLEKAAASRYGSATLVAEELGRFLRGEPILARPLGAGSRLVRTMRRKPLTSFLIVALISAIVGGSLLSLIGWRRARVAAENHRSVAEERRVDLYSANLAAAASAMEAGNRPQALDLLARCAPGFGEPDLRGCEWSVLQNLLRRRECSSVKAHDHILTALAWHPDGALLLSGSHDGSIKSWRWDGRILVPEDPSVVSPGNGLVRQLKWLRDGKSFLSSESGVIRCRVRGQPDPLWEVPGCGFSLSSDESVLAVSTGGAFFFEPAGTISLFALFPEISRRPRMVRTLPGKARAVALSPDGRWLATGLPQHRHHDKERDLDLFDLAHPETSPTHIETSGSIFTMVFSPDSTSLVTATQSSNPRMHAFKIPSGEEIPLPMVEKSRRWSVNFFPDSQTFLTTSSGRALSMIPMDGSLPVFLPLAHDNEIWSGAVSPDCRWMASGDKDGYLRIHPLPLPQAPLEAFPRHSHFRYARPIFAHDSSLLYVSATTPSWNSVAWSFSVNQSLPAGFSYFPEAITPSGIGIWRDTGARQLVRFSAQENPFPIAGIPAESWPETPSMRNHGSSADGEYFYQFSESGKGIVLEVVSGNLHQLTGFCKGVPISSALSPDGRFLVAATWEDLFVYDVHTGTTLRQSNNPHWAKCLAFSPDGSMLASGGSDGHIILRRVPDFAPIWKLSGHLSEVSGIAFSPDGRTLVSSEIGQGLRFWRLDTRREVLRVPLVHVCENLTFSRDGRSLAVVTCPPSSPPESGQVIVIPCGELP